MTTKQRAYLRGLANDLKPVLHIGKEGITDNLTAQLDGVLETRELVKVALQKGADVTAREASEELCRRTGAQAVQCIGGRFVLYRPSRDNPEIILPL